jgi:3-hydroxybutyrate dehydrogenase
MTGPSGLFGARVLVTGSTQGIGLAIARAFAAEGCRVVIHGLADEQAINVALGAVRQADAAHAEFHAADLADPAAVATLLDAVGDIDILVNNAGIQRTAPLAEVGTEIWDAILAVNLSAAFHSMRLTLPRMAERGYGRVINIASVHGLVASVDKGPYVAAKFGLIGLSRVAALEYANVGTAATGGVTVNCICPGWTATPLLEPQVRERADRIGGSEEEAIADLLSEKQPSQRLSSPDEIGALAVWLAARQAHNVTGTAIPIDGGWTAQ